MRNPLRSFVGSLLIFSLQPFSSSAQSATAESPYHTSWQVDAPVTTLGTAASYWGLTILNDKKGLTEAQALALRKTDVPRFDRFSAGYFDQKANQASNYPFYASFALAPVLIAIDPAMRGHRGQAVLLYYETMSVVGTAFTQTAGRTFRNRPLTYGADVSIREKTRRNTENSFFAGHTASASAAAFCFAKLYHDYHPGSRAQPWVWAGAAVLPAAVGYYRLEAGKHFLSDNLLGYAIGAAIGVGVPQLHKMAARHKIGLHPTVFPNGAAGMAVTWQPRR
jgi:membrane-associated phospholipid phosphatase